ncbi:MAG: protein kinase [Frankiaceae bacterium]|nr:protein kinase [Frankiaceae bacterium]MBV9871254.1 protein kinase [Frankiaceae bacterium]
MGEVWIADDQALNRKVATKLVKPEYAADPVFHQRLLAEARAAASVDNPHVVDVYDVGSATGDDGEQLSYISMELVAGQSLDEVMASGPLPAEDVMQLLSQVGEALATAHERGVVHRDIKPANLMRDQSGRITVLDFGIARAADAAALTATGHLVGTARYISPEQVAGQPAAAASDVYSLGVVAYHCVAGRPPFDCDTEVATALAHRDQEPPPLPAETPLALASLIEACLAKDPAQRPAAADVARVAGELAAGAPAPSGPVTAVIPGPDLEPADLTTDLPLASGVGVPAWLEWRRVAIVGGITVAVIGLATLIGLATDGSSSAATHHPHPKQTASTVAKTKPAAPKLVAVHASRYIGTTYAAAAQRLIRHGFLPLATGTGVQPGAVVVGISPTGRLQRGSTVTLTVAAPTPVHHVAPVHHEPPGHEKAPKPEKHIPPGHEWHGHHGD